MVKNFMRGTELGELSIFLAVTQQKSFRKAAIICQLTPSAISHAIRNLEERIGVRLFYRSTRSVSLTEAGEKFFNELQPAFNQIGKSLDNLNVFRNTPLGILKINIPNSIAPFVLKTLMVPLIKKNPGLQLDIVATDRLVDIVEEGFDAGIRFGESLDLDMIAVPIKSPLRFAVVCSPSYVNEHGLPKTPHDLHEHTCIRYRYANGNIFNWEFEQDGEMIDIKIKSSFTLETQELMVEAALQGYGLAYVWDDRVETHLQNGSLIRCLENWCGIINNLFLYYSSRHYLSAGFRTLLDMLK